ncbi:MAG: hypothetical protein HQL42_05770 [Alphaproteobacteria bacterium]|nr:hypothetical protein [Alphaproteobacteria bacterium]
MGLGDFLEPHADLIRMAMWSGARLEELCSLKADKVTAEWFDIEDAKTRAGWRRVPVHPKARATVVARLADAAAKESPYLFAGLSANKYGDRAGALGKKFTRLKNDLDFGEQHVFHTARPMK